MLYEKEHKIRETMSIMGMHLLPYYVTWFLRYFLTFLVIHVLGSIIISSTFPHLPFFLVFIVLILFDIVLIAQSFFIQIFFTKAKIGVVMALLFFILQFIISIVNENSDNPTASANRIFSICPHAAVILALKTMFYAESEKIDLTFTETLNKY